MTENQRQRLKDHKSKFLNIGVTKNGEGYDIIGVPWEKTVNAFNMHTPFLSHRVQKTSIRLCLFCCLAYRVIVTIFLNFIYMC